MAMVRPQGQRIALTARAAVPEKRSGAAEFAALVIVCAVAGASYWLAGMPAVARFVRALLGSLPL